MSGGLQVAIGQHSDKGRKPVNQDFHGAIIPAEPQLSLKGIAAVLADGISTSDVSQIASESAVKSFLTDYYCTSETWSVKTSAQRVIAATNSWLHAQTRRSPLSHDQDKGYVCTLSALVLKGRSAHIFHIGDTRIYRISGEALEQITEDHRVVISSQESYLGRALGVNHQVEIDYHQLKLDVGDTYILMSDGVYEHAAAGFIVETIRNQAGALDAAARLIVEEALRAGSKDNLTIQILRIDQLPAALAEDILDSAIHLPIPPLLEPRMVFDGYTIIRELHASSRSHAYLAADGDNGALVVLKIPSIDMRDDPDHIKRFMLEEWVARRINSAHVLKPCTQRRKRNYLYVAMEYIEGQTLAQWMSDHARPDLETVRGIVEQIAEGLQAFHRKEMVHQDLRPQNIMIDKTGTVKIIDFGSVKVRGVVEASPSADENAVLGTAQYTAPEYFLGTGGTTRADIFSLGVITYQMLTGRLPYGAQVARTRTPAQQRKLRYQPAHDETCQFPAWIDHVLQRALRIDPFQRYDEVSEFAYALRHPDKAWLEARPAPLMERNPQLFWKALSALLALIVLVLLFLLHDARRERAAHASSADGRPTPTIRNQVLPGAELAVISPTPPSGTGAKI